MGKKKIAIIIVVFLTLTIFFSSNNPFSVNADIESFTLEDGFETFIENKIYSQEENSAMTENEYFRDEFGDSCDFTEDVEGFEYYNKTTGVTHYDIDYSSGKLTMDIQTAFEYTDFKVIYNKSDIGLSLIHYNYIEISAKCGLSGYNPSMYFLNQEGKYLFPYEDRFMLTAEFQTFYYEIDINYVFHENITTLMMVFSEHDGVDLTFYDFEIDYIKFWRNNITDYASQELSDSWDWSENDNEDFVITTAIGGTEFFDDGFWEWVKVDTLKYTYITLHPIIDTTQYYQYSIRIWCNSSDYNVQYRYRNIDLNWESITIGSTIADTWVKFSVDLRDGNWENYKDNFGIMFREKSEFYLTDMFRVNYFLLGHDNFEDKVFSQSQNTSYYRASTGLYSYYHNFDKNSTRDMGYFDFTYNLNSCIIIDIPSLEMFPKKISFMIYSNSFFNISFFIGTEEFILYEKTNINSWISIRKTINREDYLVNETESELYFKIYTDYTLYDDYLEYYIDDLKIVYTEARENFYHYWNTMSGTNQEYFEINSTDNFFHAQTSGVAPYCFCDDTEGIGYNTTSNTLFSRRLFHTYDVKNSEALTVTYLRQYTTFIIDREYLILSRIYIFHYVSDPPEYDYINSRVVLKNTLYIDGINQNINNTKEIYDYFFVGYYDFQYLVSIIQEDYNTMVISSSYMNALTGNMTKTPDFSFNINEGDIKHALNSLKVTSTAIFYSRISMGHFTETNPYITYKIDRDITHSDIVATNPTLPLPEYPVWDDDHPWLSFWAFCIWFPMVFVEMVIEIFQIGFTLETIESFLDSLGVALPEFFETLLNTIENIIIDLGSILSTLLSSEGLLGSILTGIGAIATGIISLVSNVGNIWDWISNFFDNIVSPFGDFWDSFFGDFGFIGGAWGNLMDGFTSGDWGNMPELWGSMFPSMDIDFINMWKGAFSGFYIDFFGWDFVSLIDVVKDFFAIIGMVITILIVIYLIHLFKLAGMRDWDRLRIEISSLISVIVWIVSVIGKILHWIFEVIWSLLDVLIPFT